MHRKKRLSKIQTVPNSGVRDARVDRSTPMVAALVLVKDIDPRDRTRGDGVIGGGWGALGEARFGCRVDYYIQ